MGLITAGVTLACADESTRGGISKIWVANRQSVTTFVAGTVGDHEYTDVTMATSADTFFLFEFFDFTAQHTSEGELGDSGSALKNDTLEAFIPRREKSKATQIQQLFTSCKVYVIYQTFNDEKKFVLGYDEILKDDGALRVNVTENTGQELGDQNGYSLSFIGQSAEISREFSGTVPV